MEDEEGDKVEDEVGDEVGDEVEDEKDGEPGVEVQAAECRWLYIYSGDKSTGTYIIYIVLHWSRIQEQ